MDGKIWALIGALLTPTGETFVPENTYFPTEIGCHLAMARYQITIEALSPYEVLEMRCVPKTVEVEAAGDDA